VTGGRWLHVLSLERGALLWLPSLAAAAALVLFGILQAASQRGLDNHTRELRIAVGPLGAEAAVPAARRADFEAGLRRGLGSKRELVLVGAEALEARVAAVFGQPLPSEPRRWMRATRSLNVSYFVTASLAVAAGGLCTAQVELWQVADETSVAVFDAGAAAPADLGSSLADSVHGALFRPRGAVTAQR
jgi:hypothetical protein